MLDTLSQPVLETPKRKAPRPLECPQTAPSLWFQGIFNGRLLMRYSDAKGHKAKPHGASELQLFVAVTDQHDAPISEARFYRKFTKYLMEIEFDGCDDGKVATFYGRWASPRGETGPFSMPVSVRIVSR